MKVRNPMPDVIKYSKATRKPVSDMKRSLVLIAVMFSFVGCADPAPSLAIKGHVFFLGGKVVEPDEDSPTFGLDYSACQGQSFDGDHTIATGLFADVSVGVPSHAIVMRNRLVNTEEYAPIGKDEELRTDSNIIQLQEVVVTFDPDGPYDNVGDDGVVTVPHSTLVLTGADFHLGGKFVTPDIRRQLEQATEAASGGNADAQVPSFADVQAFGRTLGGDDVESNILTVPFTFCAGCIGVPDPTAGPPFPPFTDYCLFSD